MPSNVEAVVNQALMAAGIKRRIADMYEGSDAAKVAIELYGQARDELIRLQDWSFSRRVLSLTLLKGPPPSGGYNVDQPWTAIYPYPGFLYEYTYPSDCLDLRAIVPPPGQMPDLDPLPAQWRVDNDLTPVVSGSTAIGPPAKVILSNTTNAMAVYRAKVTDPTSWEPGFVAALVASLAKKFAVAFDQDMNLIKGDAAEAIGTTRAMADVRG